MSCDPIIRCDIFVVVVGLVVALRVEGMIKNWRDGELSCVVAIVILVQERFG